MKTYKIVYTESIFHIFYVDANSKEEAEEEFERLAENGELDFSGGDVFDGRIESIEMED